MADHKWSGSVKRVRIALANPPVLHLCVANAFAATFMSFQIPTFPLFAVHLGAPYILIGALAAVAPLTRLVSAIPLGLVVDRWGSRIVLILGMVSFVFSFGLVALAPGAVWLAPSRVAVGLASVATITMGVVALTEVTTSEERGSAMGLYMAGGSVGLVVGSLLGTWLITVLSFRAAYLIGAGLAVVALFHAWKTIGMPRRSVSHRAEALPWPARPQIRSLLNDRYVLLAIMSNIAFVAAIPGAASNFLPVYTGSVGIAPVALGTILAWRAVASGLARVPVGALLPLLPVRMVMALSVLLEAATAVAISWTHAYLGLAALLAFDGVLWGSYLTVSQSVVSERAHGSQRGVGLGLYQLGGSVGEVAGGVGLGLVAQMAGVAATFRVDGVVVALVLALALVMARSRRAPVLTPHTARD